MTKPEYSPEDGVLLLAETLHTQFGTRIICTETTCQTRKGGAVFLKDCGGKRDAAGRRRRRWACQSKSCGKNIGCTAYVTLAKQTLPWGTFSAVVTSTLDETKLTPNGERDWTAWTSPEPLALTPEVGQTTLGCKRKAEALEYDDNEESKSASEPSTVGSSSSHTRGLHTTPTPVDPSDNS